MTEINAQESLDNTRKSSAGKMAGCGGSALVFVAVIIFALANYLGIYAEKPIEKTAEPSTPATASTPLKLPFQKIYLGKWQAKNGTTIHIRDDGKGDFHFNDTDVSGGAVLIDEKKKILKISSVFDVSQQWKIDRAPQNKNGQMTMMLDEMEFRRVP